MSQPEVQLQRHGAAAAPVVAVAVFNRPQVLNAFRSATFDALHRILDQVRDDASLAALVLTGSGRAFCAGEDLAEMDAAGAFTVRGAYRELHRVQDLTRKLAGLGKPVVAAINGPAVGLGAELALACTARLGAEEAYLFFSEPRRAMVQTNGAFHFLPRLVGQGRAAEWLLTARRVPAEEALQAGYFTELVAAERLVERTVELAAQMARGGGSHRSV